MPRACVSAARKQSIRHQRPWRRPGFSGPPPGCANGTRPVRLQRRNRALAGGPPRQPERGKGTTLYGTVFTTAFERSCRGRHLCPGGPGVHHGVRRAEAYQLRARRSLHHRGLPWADPACELQFFGHAQSHAGCAGRLCHGRPAGGHHRLSSGAYGLPPLAERQPPFRRGFGPWGLHIFSERHHAHLRRALLRLPRLPQARLHGAPVRPGRSRRAPAGHCGQRHPHAWPLGFHPAFAHRRGHPRCGH